MVLGCARSEGYYKLTMMEKAGYLRHAHIQQKAAEDMKKIVSSHNHTNMYIAINFCQEFMFSVAAELKTIIT